MEWDFNSIINLSISLFFGILLILFIFQTTKKKRSAPHFIVLLSFGMIGGIFAFLDSSGLIADPLRILLALQLSCYGLQFFFFFLFLENLRSLKVNLFRFGIAFGLLFLQILSLWLIIWFRPFGAAYSDLWLLADIGYDTLPLFVFLICGLPVYYRMYQYTKELKPIFFMIALTVVSIGYIIISMVDYTSFFGVTPEWLDNIRDLGEIFPMTGLLLFLLTYLSNVDYIYRLANDSYLIMVTYKSGIPIHSVNLVNQKGIQINDRIVSGLLTTIDTVFTVTMSSTEHIESIVSKDATILMKSGEKITATIMTEKSSAILARALDRYVKEFESKYSSFIDKEAMKISVYDDAIELIPKIFPFFIVKKEK